MIAPNKTAASASSKSTVRKFGREDLNLLSLPLPLLLSAADHSSNGHPGRGYHGCSSRGYSSRSCNQVGHPLDSRRHREFVPGATDSAADPPSHIGPCRLG